ncbi:hypothetical protein GFY24_33955 [Nocardia sp. SYP-A9097]|uniref:hypothetical protein n=1 Tax=Nocardia sp. SYP-A9097 TaxID=2663237 RepID=UPI00129A2838|nr:hypothetical protein [Nocardia sp. SYP-A9097]MRH92371.1 hypothetical protein [Nocardia sp. SYP-A9097]
MTTARAILYDNESRELAVAQLAASLHEAHLDEAALPAGPMVSDAIRRLALPKLADAIHGLLDIDLGDATIAGWRRYAKIHEAAVRTRTGPQESVELITHELTQTYHPHLEILADGTEVGAITLDLVLALRFQPLTVTINRGNLVGLGPGECTASVEVAAERIGTIVQRERRIRTGVMINLHRPIQLA